MFARRFWSALRPIIDTPAVGLKRITTRYQVRCYDHRGRLVWTEDVQNLVTTVGVNYLLSTGFKGSAASTAWYVGLIKGASAPTFAIADTRASHGGWTEIAATDVTNANRPQWNGGSVAGGSVDNSASQAVYNINSSITLQGLFLGDNNTIAGTTGNLYGEAAFTTSQVVQAGYTVNITATLQITAG